SYIHHFLFIFFLNTTSPTQIYTLSLHDALPISKECHTLFCRKTSAIATHAQPHLLSAETSLECVNEGQVGMRALQLLVLNRDPRSEEHTSELQSPYDLVCRLLLEKKKRKEIKTD